MKICVVSTIAQHRLGLEIHLRNLFWALKDHDVRVIIQTYKSHGFYFEDSRITLLEVDSDPSLFHFFWNDTANSIRDLCGDFDFFLFMEQDVFFTKAPLVDHSMPIQLNLHSQYLSFFDESRNLIYPRIWEGGTFVRSDLVLQALESGIRLGSEKDIPDWLFRSSSIYYTTNSALHLDFVKISEHVSRSVFLDTMFEFGLYCFVNQVPYSIMSLDLNYEYGNQTVHFRGCDMIVRDNAKIYDSPSEMQNMAAKSDVWGRLCNGCAFVFLILGLYGRDKVVAKMIRNRFKKSDKLLLLKLYALRENSSEWMFESERDDLDWCISVIEQPILFS